ncbi:hypothetical protein OMK64_09025 [Cellulomonas fimi]|uniref:hypothetical protein n=1 Tax=Cellulomonas fimi TaxID=1708 RepID=UPI00234D942F|nr:hypothetical protein [Cellulomonas fimi]MDC7121677.1 hypothetical protein [Cellulomonas fimi]
MDMDYTSATATDLVLSYPSVRDGSVLRGGGHADGMEVQVEVTPFRSGTWTAPRIPRGSADVSTEGDLEDVTAADVEATGAGDVVTVLVSTTYWDTARGDPSDPREPSRPVTPLAV